MSEDTLTDRSIATDRLLEDPELAEHTNWLIQNCDPYWLARADRSDIIAEIEQSARGRRNEEADERCDYLLRRSGG